jgi:1,2-phenylacetyl-CoA epoxidase PaaB subunit
VIEPNRSPKYEPDLREKAGRLYAQHGTLAAVAAEMGITRARAAILVHESGVKVNPPGRPRAH